MGMESIFLNVFIHAPGFGRKKRRVGKKEKRSTGRAKPKAKNEKIRRVVWGGRAKAAASATPIKGAVQGEATATARSPEANAPAQPWLFFFAARPPKSD
jgi:hypothetical protein